MSYKTLLQIIRSQDCNATFSLNDRRKLREYYRKKIVKNINDQSDLLDDIINKINND